MGGDDHTEARREPGRLVRDRPKVGRHRGRASPTCARELARRADRLDRRDGRWVASSHRHLLEASGLPPGPGHLTLDLGFKGYHRAGTGKHAGEAGIEGKGWARGG